VADRIETLTVDARGKACPQPVVLAGKAMDGADAVTVIVDERAAVENVTRLARSRGFALDRSDRPDGTWLVLRRQGSPPAPADQATAGAAALPAPQPAASAPVVLCTSDALGHGPAELGERLLAVFLNTLLEVAPRPRAVVFMNTGVRLTVNGSRALDDLRALAGRGVEVLSCGTCLNYFGLAAELAVGRVSNMFEIATLLLEAGRVVQL
jgi:selenium metabolism protein YedF